MNRKIWISVVFVVATMGSILVVVMSPEEQGPRLTDVLDETLPKNDPRRRDDGSFALPKARVDHPVHNFGTLDPLTTAQHTFIVYNDGESPLRLEQGPTTCKCTISDLAENEIPPGAYGNVLLQWHTGRNVVEYAHSATIYTNDPLRKRLDLRVEGRVRAQLVADPAQLTFSRLAPGQPGEASTVVYSQVWDEMSVPEIICSLENAKYSFKPLSVEECQQRGCLSGYVISCKVPGDLPSGYFRESLQVNIDLGDEDGSLEIPVEGKVLRRLSLYGQAVEVDGKIDIGHVQQGQSKQIKLLMKVHDSERKLPLKAGHHRPSSLDVRVAPYKPDDGLYHLIINVPPDAPRFRPGPTEMGEIHLEFDHPRIRELTLPVDLIIDRPIDTRVSVR